jgi:hypothetical protein
LASKGLNYLNQWEDKKSRTDGKIDINKSPANRALLCLLVLLFSPEDRGITFHQNDCKLLSSYMT